MKLPKSARASIAALHNPGVVIDQASSDYVRMVECKLRNTTYSLSHHGIHAIYNATGETVSVQISEDANLTDRELLAADILEVARQINVLAVNLRDKLTPNLVMSLMKSDNFTQECIDELL